MKNAENTPKNLFLVRKCAKGPNKRGFYVVKAREVTGKGIKKNGEKEIYIREKVSKGDLIQITKNGVKVIKGED